MNAVTSPGWLLLLGLMVFPDRLDGWQAETAPLAPRQFRTLDSYFPFEVPQTLEQWQTRREQLRRHIQISLGLWPLPEKTPLNSVIYGRIDMGQYTIEKVYFESFPGFHVTGNLYRPADATGKRPAILSPHGHFPEGRFHWASDDEIRKQISSGAESMESNARSPLQARCANLAKMGCVVFHYDMIGYADSQQLTHQLAHGFREQRPHMNSLQSWGFFSPQAELRLQSIMGLQTWNSIRSLDFLCSLPDVDAARIGVTGASGGGTQTFILCAIDPRPAAAFPAVMVSTGMQGGCTCENCCNLRIGTGNVEVAALFAPKPLGLTAANDWTREMQSRGFPELQRLYALYFPKADHSQLPVELTSRTEFGHNYNQVSREVMYRFMNRHLKLGLSDDQTRETPVQLLGPHRLSVYDDDHPKPSSDSQLEPRLLRDWEQAGAFSIPQGEGTSRESIRQFRQSMEQVLRSLIQHPAGRPELKLSWRFPQKDRGRSVQFGQLVSADSTKTRIVIVFPQRPAVSQGVFLILNHRGVDGLLERLDDEQSLESRALAAGSGPLVAMDWLPGDSTKNDAAEKNRFVNNGREAAGYTYGYNRTLFASRVSQVLDLTATINRRFSFDLQVLCDRMSSPVAITARAMRGKVDSRGNSPMWFCELDGFRFTKIGTLRHEHFFPGIVKFGGLEALLMANRRELVAINGETEASFPAAVKILNSCQRTVIGFAEHPGKKIPD